MDNSPAADGDVAVTATVAFRGEKSTVSGTGNGPIAAYANALESLGIDFEVMEYSQQSRSAGDDAEAACYILADVKTSGSEAGTTTVWGAGIAGSTTAASLHAINSAVNRAVADN